MIFKGLCVYVCVCVCGWIDGCVICKLFFVGLWIGGRFCRECIGVIIGNICIFFRLCIYIWGPVDNFLVFVFYNSKIICPFEASLYFI